MNVPSLVLGLAAVLFALSRAPKGMVVMPSRAVDALWHAFILDTRAYGGFGSARTSPG